MRIMSGYNLTSVEKLLSIEYALERGKTLPGIIVKSGLLAFFTLSYAVREPVKFDMNLWHREV